MSEEARARLGDRVERALEERADAEREIERGEAESPGRAASIRRTAFWLGVTGVSLYLVAPSLIDVFGSVDELDTIQPAWLPALFALQALGLACLWVVQRLALHDPPWAPVIESQLAGNALSKIAPGGGALGAALQYRMLVEAGIERARAVAGITAVNLLTFAVVLALPVLALPAFVRGARKPRPGRGDADRRRRLRGPARRRGDDARFRRPLELGGPAGPGDPQPPAPQRRAAADAARAPAARARPSAGHARTALEAARSPRPVARWAFDYATLLAALAAVGSTPRPALRAARLLRRAGPGPGSGHPGGLGFVEAGLTATLALAGVEASDAILATLAYRLFSYWLPLPVGLVAFTLHRRRIASA